MSALIFADDRPTSCDDDLYQWAMDAEAMIRNLHTENTALRVTEDNLRQELQECQDQRRAAFRRIEELDAMRAQIGQGEPVAWIRPSGKAMLEAGGYCTVYASDGMSNHSTPLYTHPAPQQKPLTGEQINQMWSDAHNDTSTMSLIHVLARAIEAAHNIGEKK